MSSAWGGSWGELPAAGQGTVFASMFSVSVEQPTVTVTRRAKQQVPEAIQTVHPSRLPTPGKTDNKLSVFTATERITVLTAPDEITVTSSTQSVSMVTRLSSATIYRK